MAVPMKARKSIFKSMGVAAFLFGALTLGRLTHEYVPMSTSSRQLKTSVQARGGDAAVQTLPSAARLDPSMDALPILSGLASAAVCGALAAAMFAVGVVSMGLQVPTQWQQAEAPQTSFAQSTVDMMAILPLAGMGAAMVCQATQTCSIASPVARASPVKRMINKSGSVLDKRAVVVKTNPSVVAKTKLLFVAKPSVLVKNSQGFRFRLADKSPQKTSRTVTNTPMSPKPVDTSQNMALRRLLLSK